MTLDNLQEIELVEVDDVTTLAASTASTSC